MALQQIQEQKTIEEIWNAIQRHKRSNEWQAIVDQKRFLPKSYDVDWIGIADEIAFALGQLGRYEEAIALWERNYELDACHRRASAAAYVFYVALLQAKTDRKLREQRDRRADMDGFQHWIARALEHRPDSVKDLYRLGVFFAQIHNGKDRKALEAFRKAVSAYENLKPRLQERFEKTYVQALYGAARSAFRLKRYRLAAQLIAQCLAADERSGYLAHQYKYGLAGKIAAASGHLEEAERAFLRALEHPERNHAYLFGELAKVRLAMGDPAGAARWIEENVPVHRRRSVLWRLLGDARFRQGRLQEAEAAFRNALHKDRAGRHLTLVLLGKVLLAQGRLKEARKAFKDANKFRKKHYVSEDLAALEGLLEVSLRQGNEELAAEYRARLDALQEKRQGGWHKGGPGGAPGDGARQEGRRQDANAASRPREPAPTATDDRDVVAETRQALKVRGLCLLPDGVTRAPRWKVSGKAPLPTLERHRLPTIWDVLGEKDL